MLYEVITNHPNVAVLWDMHHPYRYMGETAADTINNIGPYIRHVHVKDSVMKDGKAEYKLMGEGDLPLDEMLTSLGNYGYNGYISLEWSYNFV